MPNTPTQEQRLTLAKRGPDATGYKYHTAWFADIRNDRAHACDCPDYFHRNTWAGDPSHICYHLRTLAESAVYRIWQEVTDKKDGNVFEIADALGIPRLQSYHRYAAVYIDGEFNAAATVRSTQPKLEIVR